MGGRLTSKLAGWLAGRLGEWVGNACVPDGERLVGGVIQPSDRGVDIAGGLVTLLIGLPLHSPAGLPE